MSAEREGLTDGPGDGCALVLAGDGGTLAVAGEGGTFCDAGGVLSGAGGPFAAAGETFAGAEGTFAGAGGWLDFTGSTEAGASVGGAFFEATESDGGLGFPGAAKLVPGESLTFSEAGAAFGAGEDGPLTCVGDELAGGSADVPAGVGPDDFDAIVEGVAGEALDRSAWVAVGAPTSGVGVGGSCAVDRPSDVVVEGTDDGALDDPGAEDAPGWFVPFDAGEGSTEAT